MKRCSATRHGNGVGRPEEGGHIPFESLNEGAAGDPRPAKILFQVLALIAVKDGSGPGDVYQPFVPEAPVGFS